MTEKNQISISIALLSIIFAIKIAWASIVPLAFDESYYVIWARSLDWGYLDHPPGVALLSYFGRDNTSFLLARLPSLLVSFLTVWPIVNICKILDVRDLRHILLACLLFFASLVGLSFGVLTLPDTGLIFFWLLATQELLKALIGKQQSWLTLGLCVGLGFLCKYIMILYLPIILISILLTNKSLLKNKYVWIGFVFCLLSVSPHLSWNAQNDWISFRFQAKRGLSNSHNRSSQYNHLPKTLPQTTYEDMSIASRLVDPLDIERKKKKVKKHPFNLFMKRLSEYWLSILMAWGAISIVLLFFFYRARPTRIEQKTHQVLNVVTFFPILFFGAIALFTKVEGNWASVFATTASVSLALIYKDKFKQIFFAAGVNIALVFLLFLYAAFGTGPIEAKRLIKEANLYDKLNEAVQDNASFPLFTERYQIASQINYYAKSQIAYQFPGLKRDSEFVRRLNPPTPQNSFSLLGETFPPPSFEGYKIRDMFEFRKCRNGDYQIRKAEVQDAEPICRKKAKVQVIYLTNYISKP